MSLNNIIVQKLQELNLKLGIVETSSNGMVCSNFAILPDYDKVFKIGLVVNDPSLFWKFDIEQETFISINTSRKLAKYLRDEYACDVVLAIASSSDDQNLKIIEKLEKPENANKTNGHAYISVLVIDRYSDFELQFKSEGELRDRILITNKAMNELLSVVLKLK